MPAAEQEKAAEPAPPPAGPPALIEGFRQAHFGMNEAELRQAIHKDFPKSKIASAMHPGEKTTVLSLSAADLLPDTPPAQVSYILGHHSKQLIQVNIVWPSDGRSEKSDAAVVATANALRDYFAAQNYKPDTVVKNRKLAESAILVFRADDVQGHTVLLVLSGAAAAARHGDKPPPPLTLELSYIKDSAHPDIFRIGKGQF